MPGDSGSSGVEVVRVDSDADLDAFARHVLRLFESPERRDDVRAGRVRFRLARSGVTPSAPDLADLPVRRIERGAVTEPVVREAAAAGAPPGAGPASRPDPARA